MGKLGHLVLFLLIAFVTQAANVSLKASDGFGASSFASGSNWSDGLPPSSGNDYFTSVYRLRTPADNGSYVFAGASLTLNATAGAPGDLLGLSYKGTGAGAAITINNLVLDGGSVNHINGPGDTFNLYGNISVIADSYLHAKQGPMNVYSNISGSAAITNPTSDTSGCTLFFHSAASTFTGSIVNNGRFTLADDAVLNFVISADGVNNSVSGTGAETVFNGDFNIDLFGAGANPADSWAIVTASNATYGDTFTVIGFTDEGEGIWSTSANGVTYQFDESTGVLSVYTPQLHADPISGILFDAEYAVLNYNMTLPGSVVNPGWDGEGGRLDIPGWTAIAPGTTDGGTGGGGTGPSADGDGWHAAVQSIDPGVYNIADANLVEGVTYTFTGHFAPRWGLVGGEMSVIADDDPNILLATAPITFPDGVDHSDTWYGPYTVSYTATAADAGKKIGIYIDALGEAGWLRFDDIHLYAGYLELHGVIDHNPIGANVEPAAPLALSWTPTNDPNFDGAGVDDQVLYYYIGDGDGSDPDYASYVGVSGISKGIAAASHSVAVGMATDQYCLWRVDTVMDGVTYTGQTVLFTTRTADEIPVLTPGNNWITWRDQAVTLTADVNDFGEGDVADADNVWSIVNAAPWSAVMQMYNRAGDGDLTALITAGYDAALFEDWIGTDARGNLAALEPLTLTLSGVPAGTYTWTSYHHDVADQTGPFDVTVVDASGSTTTAGVDITDGAVTPVSEFSTTITSDGSDIQLVFDSTGTENNTAMFVMNGFVLSDGVNPDLAVDFGAAANTVAGGYQAYTAEHEVEASFTTQAFSALGTSVAVTPSWDTASYYAALTDVSSDPLAPAAAFVSNWTADYTIELNSTDRGGSMGDQAAAPVQMTVRVTADACAAAVLSGIEYNLYDSDEDCDVDLADFAAFAAQWLEDVNLTGPVAE